jgi:hypothetical protein
LIGRGQQSVKRIMKIVVTKTVDLEPRGIACRNCAKLLSTLDKAADTLTPSVEQLLASGAIPVPNFGWFCGQDCGDAYSRQHGITFQRDANGRIAY